MKHDINSFTWTVTGRPHATGLSNATGPSNATSASSASGESGITGAEVPCAGGRRSRMGGLPLGFGMLVFSFLLATAWPVHARAEKKVVVCTTGMIGDVARQIGGDHVAVTNIIGEGIDPHLYRPTRSDLAKLLRADLVFYNGLLLEGRMSSALDKISSKKRVRAVGDAIDHDRLIVPDGQDGHPDPHIWMDVALWKRASELIRDELVRLLPSKAEDFKARCAAYAKELDRLDTYARHAVESVPKQQRLLVTAHDAFHYMGRAYGFDVRGIQGISTESEAGIADVNALVDLLVERNVEAIFVETSVSDKNVRALIEGAAARGHDVSIGGTLFSDAMGAARTYEGTYVGMIDHNVTVIAEALGGKVPRKGLNERLTRSHGDEQE